MDSKSGAFNILDYRETIAALDQAIFYVYDDQGNRQPIGLISHFTFEESGKLYFCTTRLPLTAANWESFDAELQFHKKGLTTHLLLSGVAKIEDSATRFICFHATDALLQGDVEKPSKATYLMKQWAFIRGLIGQQRAASF